MWGLLYYTLIDSQKYYKAKYYSPNILLDKILNGSHLRVSENKDFNISKKELNLYLINFKKAFDTNKINYNFSYLRYSIDELLFIKDFNYILMQRNFILLITIVYLLLLNNRLSIVKLVMLVFITFIVSIPIFRLIESYFSIKSTYTMMIVLIILYNLTLIYFTRKAYNPRK